MPRQVSLHDTSSGRVRPLAPSGETRIGIYACGPTVYGRVHVGNARPFVVFSLLARFLAREGYEVSFVSNITDVNDKIYAAAAARGVPSAELAREMTAHYVADTDALGLGRPDHEPLAGETIGPIVELIERLVQTGHAYPSGGDVYFSVRSSPGYGRLSHRHLDEMDQGEEAGVEERKRDRLDFALWKAHKPGEDTCWESPWGPGRPGWHIECSAMAEQLLGLEFAVHGGGSDLLFPHHENEAAQTEAARGRPLARLWVHVGMVRWGADKMSKSVGNVFVLHEALERYGRDALLMYFCSAHYRQPVQFDEERMAEAEQRCERIREAGRRLVAGPSPPWSSSLRERFADALADDFNLPEAMARVFEWVREANRERGEVGDADVRAMLELVGLAGLLERAPVELPPRALELLAERERARAARDFAAADRLREQVREAGFEIRDGPGGPELVPVRRP